MLIRNSKYGLVYDTEPTAIQSGDPFGDVREAVANMNATPADNGSGGTIAEPAVTEPDNTPQDVDPTPGQGTKTPATSGEKSTEDVPADKNKPEPIEAVRKWGQGWETTAKNHEKRIKDEFEPLVTKINETFGGNANLEVAGEIYKAVADEANFDPANAFEYLAENLPEVATKLSDFIGQGIVETATATALKRTFGRELSEDEVNNVRAFLAAGGQPDKVSKLLAGEDLPDSLLTDNDGNPLPPQVVDFMRHQQAELKKVSGKLGDVMSRIESGEKETKTTAAAQAIEAYVFESLSPITTKISEMNLDKPIEGETPEITAMRSSIGSAIEALVLHKASQDEKFQAIWSKAIESVGRAGKSKVAMATATDYQQRLQDKLTKFATEAAEFLSPLLDVLASGRKAQVTKTQQNRGEVVTSGEKPTNTSNNESSDDPFNRDSIRGEVADIIRTRHPR